MDSPVFTEEDQKTKDAFFASESSFHRIESWYPLYKDLTFESVTITLSRPEAELVGRTFLLVFFF